MSRVDDFVLKVRYIYKYVKEDSLVKVGLSASPRRSHENVPKGVEKKKHTGEPSLKIAPKCPQVQQSEEAPLSRKRKADGDAERPSSLKSLKIHIPEDILNHSCTGFQSAEALVLKLSEGIKDWNKEFVKNKYVQGEYQRRFEALMEENKSLEVDLAACRTELSTISTSFSVHRQEADRTRSELIESRAEITDVTRSLRGAEAKVLALEAENKRLQKELSENSKGEAALKIIKVYKESYDFKSIIQDNVEKERSRIFDVEVKDLERQYREDGFISGFLKGTRLVHRRTGANIEGLTWSQVSEEPALDLEDDAESVMPSEASSDDEINSI